MDENGNPGTVVSSMNNSMGGGDGVEGMEQRLTSCIEKALQGVVVERQEHEGPSSGRDAREVDSSQPATDIASALANQTRHGLRPEDLHVLVVDDERMSRTIVSSLLKKCKYSVTTAEDGAEAMELLRSHPPGTFHLVLTDVQMPHMNGLELLQYIRSEETLRCVPVVMMSSYDNGNVVYDCVEGGAEEYLVKPVTQKEVQRIWQHVLKKRSVATTVPQADAKMMQNVALTKEVDTCTSGETGREGKSTVTSDFLKMMRNKRIQEIAELRSQVSQLEKDCSLVERICGMEMNGHDGKRQKFDSAVLDKKKELDNVYFTKIHNEHKEDALKHFARDLNVMSQMNAFHVTSVIRSGNMANPQEMVCCADFDADDLHFATVSVSRSVKVFDFESMMATPDALQFPVWQATTRAKLSSVSWNSYIRSHLITSDYDGCVQLWDVSSGATNELTQFEEHSKRIWSIDFSRLDPLQFASASDDSTVRLWNLQQSSSIDCLKTPANACSVHFCPFKATTLAVACANHNSYIFDTRKTASPIAVLTGASRAVSYVRFLDRHTVIGASTDNTVRAWNLDTEGDVVPPAEEYKGHANERNFVGLSVHQDGFIATGSEDNSVCCYYRAFPFPITQHMIDAGDSESDKKPMSSNNPRTFVSSVSWARHSKHLLVGNSEGVLQVLHMKEFKNDMNTSTLPK